MRMEKRTADIKIKGDSHISGQVNIGLPYIGNQHTGPELFIFPLAIQFSHKLPVTVPHPGGIPRKEPSAFLLRNPGIQLLAQIVYLPLLFQKNKRKVIIIIADAKLLTSGYPADLFPQRLIPVIVKLNTADQIPPVTAHISVSVHDM